MLRSIETMSRKTRIGQLGTLGDSIDTHFSGSHAMWFDR